MLGVTATRPLTHTMLGVRPTTTTTLTDPPLLLFPFISETKSKALTRKPSSLSFPSPLFRSRSRKYPAISAVANPAQSRADFLLESLPFIQKHRGKTVVVEYGGAAEMPPELQESVINDLAVLSCLGLRPVIVHGVRPEINDWLQPESVFRDGLRVTDDDAMEIVSSLVKKVNEERANKVNRPLVSLILKAGAMAVGLTGMNSNLITARARPMADDLGLVGELAQVNTGMLRPLIDDGFIPVVLTVAADEFGQPYNINPRTVAAELAGELDADMLILLKYQALEDKDGPKNSVEEIGITRGVKIDITKGVKELMKNKKIHARCNSNLICFSRALKRGVRAVATINVRAPHSLLQKILIDEDLEYWRSWWKDHRK